MDADPTRRPHPPGEGPHDPDRSTGPDQAGHGTAPTAGHAARVDDAALGLGGSPQSLMPTDASARGDERALSEEGETGLEVGNSTLGSSANAAERVDAFNVPGQGDDAR